MFISNLIKIGCNVTSKCKPLKEAVESVWPVWSCLDRIDAHVVVPPIHIYRSHHCITLAPSNLRHETSSRSQRMNLATIKVTPANSFDCLVDSTNLDLSILAPSGIW